MNPIQGRFFLRFSLDTSVQKADIYYYDKHGNVCLLLLSVLSENLGLGERRSIHGYLVSAFSTTEARPRIKTILGLFGLHEWICDGSELGIT
jgi:hypothetical protein